MPNPGADSPNPYQPPQMDVPAFTPATSGNLRLMKVLRDFRTQIVALGVVWLLLAGLVLGASAMLGGMLEGDDSTDQIFLIVMGVCGLIWGTLGIGACLKQMWAVYAGLVLSYLSAAGNLPSLNLCPIIILAVVIIQAHRVIGFARELQRAGIPLTARPQDLEIKLQMPV